MRASGDRSRVVVFTNSRATHLTRENFQAVRKTMLDYKSSQPVDVPPTPTLYSPQTYNYLMRAFEELKADE